MSEWVKERVKRKGFFPGVPAGTELFDIIRRENGSKIIMSFSLGKDSIAAWIALQDYFDITPCFQYFVPGLEFEEEALAYFEKKFKTRIIRLPHMGVFVRLNDYIYQSPERCRYIDAARLPDHTFEDIRKWICGTAGLKEDTYYATGVRAHDNPMRRTAIRKHGPITRKDHKFHAIWDWSLADVIESLKTTDTKLPKSYRVFGSSFDNLAPRYMIPLRQHYPKDYQKLLEWYPQADLVCFRYDMALKRGLLPNPYRG